MPPAAAGTGWLTRSLIYRTMICTKLRKSKLASITPGQTRLNGPRRWFELPARDENAGQDKMTPLRTDLAGEVREFVQSLQSRADGKVLPRDTRLPKEPCAGVRADHGFL